MVSKNVGGSLGSASANFLRNNSINATLHIDTDAVAWNRWYKEVYGILEGVGEAGHQAVDTAVNKILETSRTYVPVDTGTLAESGYCEVQSLEGRSIGSERRSTVFRGTVGYGGTYGQDTGVINPRSHTMPEQYAWKIHEDMSLNHPHGGQAKFLERAYREYIFMEWPNEMVALETTILNSNRLKNRFTYGSKSKTFHVS